jgi:hypothetical protein
MKKILILLISLTITLPVFAGEGNRFVFTQLKYDGKWDPYPETWQDILEFLATTTNIILAQNRRVITIYDSALFSSPFLVILGNGGFPRFDSRQTELFRRYVSNGGMVFVEDSTGLKGSQFDSQFRSELSRIFPEKRLVKLEMGHPLFRAYYLLRKIGGRRITNNYLEGMDFAGRIGIVYSQNDLIGAWAKDRFGNYLWDCVPGGENQRFEAQKLTLNLIMYIVTGTYKSDAIHQPYIQMKLRR